VLLGPKNLSPDMVFKMEEVFRKVSEDPAFLKFMEGAGFTVHYESTEDLRKRTWQDYNASKGIFERIGQKQK
jgi:tripartite-type tricarboxylate transporter receptor subunit TctC